MADTSEPRLGILASDAERVSAIMADIRLRLSKMANRLRPAEKPPEVVSTGESPRSDTHLERLDDATRSALGTGKQIHDLLAELEGLI